MVKLLGVGWSPISSKVGIFGVYPFCLQMTNCVGAGGYVEQGSVIIYQKNSVVLQICLFTMTTPTMNFSSDILIDI